MRTILKNQHDKTSATTEDHEIGILLSKNCDVAEICGNTQKYSVKCISEKKPIAGEKKKRLSFWHAIKLV